MLYFLESNKNLIKEFREYGEIFYFYIKLLNNSFPNIKSELSNDFERIEELMNRVLNMEGKSGFENVINHAKNIMLESLRNMHFVSLKKMNKKNMQEDEKYVNDLIYMY